MEYQVFLCIFQKNLAMATLGLKKWENSYGKVGKKVCPVGCLSLVKPKVAIADFFGKMQRKTWYSIFGVDAMPLSLKTLFLI